MDVFAASSVDRLVNMTNPGSNESLESPQSLSDNEDIIMEQILENINTTPLGQVLKKIASLPELRQEKILNLRRQLNQGRYSINDRLDIVVDKVLEDLTT